MSSGSGVPWLALGALVLIAGLSVWALSLPAPRPVRRKVRISVDDPLLREARDAVRRTLPLFRALLADHPGSGLVKLRVERSDGRYEGWWGDVLAADDRGVHVRPRGTHQVREVAWEDVEDWQIELPGGRFRGAFTVVAAWRIHERSFGDLPAQAVRDLPRFVDAALRR